MEEKKEKGGRIKSSIPASGTRKARALAYQKRIPIQDIVLRTLYATGIVATALVAPNAVQIFGLPGGKEARRQLYRRIDQARFRLKSHGLIHVSGYKAQLTGKGMKRIEGILTKEYRIKETLFWDGKWRVAIFDVIEKRRRVRNRLRTLLRGAGFYRLQDSVWVFPYPCDEFIELLRANLRSGTGEMLFFTTEPFAGDRRLREEFDL